MNLQLDHFPMITKTTTTQPRERPLTRAFRCTPTQRSQRSSVVAGLPLDARSETRVEARLSQRVAMDDLASYFVEERSKVR